MMLKKENGSRNNDDTAGQKERDRQTERKREKERDYYNLLLEKK